MPIITLTTDFGWRDGYVGAMKGVIARLAPDVTIVDIAHDVPRGDIAHAAWVVRTSTVEFPHDTVHVVVVDPGVGGTRQAVVARVPAEPPRGAQLYVGPDNGVFAYLPIDKAWEIRTSELGGEISPTFHGRDVFAPAAAEVAKGRQRIYGPYVTLEGALPWGARAPGTGRIVHIDTYGNLITDLPAHEVSGQVVYEDSRVLRLARTYEAVKVGELFAYVGSAGTIEIAARDGWADKMLEAKRGELVVALPGPEHNEGPYR